MHSSDEQLQTLIAALAGASTGEQVADILVTQGRAAVAAGTALVSLLSKDGSELVCLRAEGLPADVAAASRSFPADSSLPIAEAVRTDQPILLGSLLERQLRYPDTIAAPFSPPGEAFAVIPIRQGQIVGALRFTFPTARSLDEDRDLLLTLGRLAGMALERARLQEAERSARLQLRELTNASRQKDEFLATLAHELRNPLAPIWNALHMLRLLGPLNPHIQTAADVLVRQVGQMTRTMDELLAVDRIGYDPVTLHKERLELSAVVAAAVEASKPALEARGHHLTVSLPSTPLWLEGDQSRLAEALEHLLSNAAKYSDRGSPITLTAARERNWAVLRVKDQGMGIPAELLPRVFDLFRLGDRAEGRLGIGLAVVKRLVEMHGGIISAHSAGPGKGSEFVIRLPLLPGR